eukprot:6505137-Prymnesium_polylepis.2
MSASEAPPLTPGMVEALVTMQQMQQTRSLRRVNELATTCFDECIDDFAMSRQLRSGEADCIQACTEKYLAFSVLVGKSFVTSIANDPRFKAASQ